MKKLILAGLLILSVGCSSLPTNLTSQDFVGEWSCATKYERIGVGTIDLITLNSDGSVYDENFIFDNVAKRITDEKIDNYFQSPFKYLTINKGKWNFKDNRLIYSLRKESAKRLIYPSVWASLQESEYWRGFEEKIFAIYSSKQDKDDVIELNVVKYNKKGFTLIQDMGERRAESVCVPKEKADFRFNGMLEILKQIAKKNKTKS